MRRLGIGATVVVLAGILLACGTSSTLQQAAATGTTSKHPTATATTAGPTIVHVGDVLTLNGYECGVLKVKQLQPGEFDQIKSGDEYVVVTVKLVNKTSDAQDYNELDFAVKSGTGNLTNTTYSSAYTANNDLGYGTLAVNGSVTGDLVFEVKKGDHQAMLTWSPNFTKDTEDGWLLGL